MQFCATSLMTSEHTISGQAMQYIMQKLTMTRTGPWSTPHLHSVVEVVEVVSKRVSGSNLFLPHSGPMCLAGGCKKQDDIWGCAE